MKLGQLSEKLGLVLHGNPEHELSKVAPIESAGAQELAFVVGAKFARALSATKAGAVIVPQSMLDLVPSNALISPNPYASFAATSWLLSPEPALETGIHATAVIHPDASISTSASIGPFVTVGKGSVVSEHAVIGAHSTLGDEVHIGQSTRLFERVTIYKNVSVGEQCRVQSGAVIGSEGFGYAWDKQSWLPIQQIGGVNIGNRVHIGANTTIDCGTIEPTVIEDGVILDNQIQIAHNVHIGRNTAIAGCVGVAGSTHIGKHCQIGGACNIVGHISIADEVVVNAASLVTRSIEKKGRYGSGAPLQEEHAWRRSFVTLGKLDGLLSRIKRLEKASDALK